MYPIVGTPFDRVVPKGGAILSGYFIPEGTVVGISGWVMQRNKQVLGMTLNLTVQSDGWMQMKSRSG